MLKHKVQLAFFMGYIKQSNEGEFSLHSKQFTDYKENIKLVAEKIDRWHVQVKQSNKNKFLFDSDFLDSMNSPNDLLDESEDEPSSSSSNS